MFPLEQEIFFDWIWDNIGEADSLDGRLEWLTRRLYRRSDLRDAVELSLAILLLMVGSAG